MSEHKIGKNRQDEDEILDELVRETKDIMREDEDFDSADSNVDTDLKNSKPRKKKIKLTQIDAKKTRTVEVSPIMKIIKWLVFVQAAMSVVAVAALIRMNILQTWQNVLIIGLLSLLFIVEAVVLFGRFARMWTRWLAVVVAVMVTTACIYASTYLVQTISFIEKITGVETRTITYSVLVKDESPTRKIDELNGATIGFIDTDIYTAKAEAELGRTIKMSPQGAENIGTVIGYLENGDVSAVAMNETYLNILKGEGEEEKSSLADYYNKMREIYTFQIIVTDEVVMEENEVDVTSEPFILYLSGSDSRTGLTTNSRSDVNIIIAVNPETHKILMVSIPRDAYVQLAGTTGIKDKLTHAGIYGINMSKATIENLLGIKIDYTAKATFSTVINLVDAVGGIEINSDATFRAYTDSKCNFTTGVQHVDGKCALAYARERKTYTTGDRHRNENQEQVIALLFAKIMQPEFLVKYPTLLSVIEGTFSTTLAYDDITNFVREQLSAMANWTIETYNVNGVGSMQGTYSMGANRPLYVMIIDENTINTARQKITDTLTKIVES